MKKIRLNVEKLKVETFQTDEVELQGGTVRGWMATDPRRSDCLNTCDGCPTYSCRPVVCL
ncbi:MAG: hypothetical protein JO306_13480 [Gemmatimonadetes bacterium]|nr:hypothetical protein [Gemmatimonadota bacterium]